MSFGAISCIPMTELASYMLLYDIRDDDEKDFFILAIKAMDSLYMERMAAKMEKDSKIKGKGGKGGKVRSGRAGLRRSPRRKR